MPTRVGDARAIGCALAWAFAVMAFRRVRGVDAATIAAILLLLTMLAIGMRFDLDRPALDWAALALSGVLGLAVADTLFLAGLSRVDASVAALGDCAYAQTVCARHAWRRMR